MEEQFLVTRRYVSFDKKNGKTFSSEFIKLLQAICSEIDVLAKEIAKYKNPNFKIKESYIAKWGFMLVKSYPFLSNTTVQFNNDYILSPWKKTGYVEYYNKDHNLCYKRAEGCENPEWWRAYNKVKHERTSIKDKSPNYEQANLKNVVNALGALYILEQIMLSELSKKRNDRITSSKLFRLNDKEDNL